MPWIGSKNRVEQVALGVWLEWFTVGIDAINALDLGGNRALQEMNRVLKATGKIGSHHSGNGSAAAAT
jgi:hypothetical protein